MAAVNVIGVLDMSGSMGELAGDLRGGYNAYLDGLQGDDENTYKISTTVFDTEFIQLYKETPVENAPRLTKENYMPRGSTALWDAIGHTLNEARNMENEKVLCVIYTDGYENSSKEFRAEQIKEMVQAREKAGNWDFIFLGAGINAWATGEVMGLGRMSTSVEKTRVGTAESFSTLTMSTQSYAAGKAKWASEEFAKKLPESAKLKDPEDPKTK